MVPDSIIIVNALALFILIALFLATFFLLRRKVSIQVIPLLVGIAFFIIFSLVLEQGLHSIVLQPNAQGQITLMNTHPLFYILYGIFAAGIFEELARFIAFKLLKQGYANFGTSLAYGLGHGGIEMLILGGGSLLGNLIISILLRNPNGQLAQELPSSIIQALQNTSAGEIFYVVIERFPVLLVQICLSVLVWVAVNKTKQFWLFPLSILIHALIDLPGAMVQVGFLSNYAVLYGLLYLMTAGLIFFTIRIVKSNEFYPLKKRST
ncbi:YhfC family intramembrane metalloprotease [Tetragenococcus halophilus]|uniref:YhfC family intramembrane metalloprotease n=1 Tax=Tetragenococcus halophilus TaxID=51669 RepID=UPI001F203D3E|nr:YhfC family glutamic-type intramembrane protease [Tetragenococcus halophilus]MCF1602316.1 YhfC family intramembrane metalloprotease [Tetragenococcus halophilus]MCF1675108.1 YhfC family intramembrane metalloprotease [Tetragenococcus halophilus]MCO8292754.1 YhfC family intramembrane metalloprotease [Tetragenococcus halophilus]